MTEKALRAKMSHAERIPDEIRVSEYIAEGTHRDNTRAEIRYRMVACVKTNEVERSIQVYGPRVEECCHAQQLVALDTRKICLFGVVPNYVRGHTCSWKYGVSEESLSRSGGSVFSLLPSNPPRCPAQTSHLCSSRATNPV